MHAKQLQNQVQHPQRDTQQQQALYLPSLLDPTEESEISFLSLETFYCLSSFSRVCFSPALHPTIASTLDGDECLLLLKWASQLFFIVKKQQLVTEALLVHWTPHSPAETEAFPEEFISECLQRAEFGWRKGSIALTQLAELHSMDATWTEREMKCAEWFMLKILLWLILLEAQSLKIEHRLLKGKKCPQDSSAKLRQTFTDVSLRWFNIIYNTGCLTCRPCFLSKRLLKLLCSLFAPQKLIVLDLYSFLLEVFTCNTSLTSVFKNLSHTLQPKSTFKPENLDWIWTFIKLWNSL